MTATATICQSEVQSRVVELAEDACDSVDDPAEKAPRQRRDAVFCLIAQALLPANFVESPEILSYMIALGLSRFCDILPEPR